LRFALLAAALVVVVVVLLRPAVSALAAQAAAVLRLLSACFSRAISPIAFWLRSVPVAPGELAAARVARQVRRVLLVGTLYLGR
jgi:hypothetical protein